MSWFSKTVDYDISSSKIELKEEKPAPPTPPSGWDDYQRERVRYTPYSEGRCR